jgi:multidrug efflux system outer membrane protein
MSRIMLSVVALASLVVGGCRTLAPEYARPDAPVPDAFSQTTTADAPSAADVPWQSFLTDARLQAVVERALTENRNLRTAALNVERARALYRIQQTSLVPRVDATASAVRQRIPEGLFGGAGGFNVEQYSANVGVSAYELDLFGRLRSLNEQALQGFLATTEARRAVQVALVAEVTQAWLTYGADVDRLTLAHETLAAQDASLQLTRQRLDAGVASALDVRQAETTVERARADVAQFTARVGQDRLALDLIVGDALDEALLPGGGLSTVAALQDVPVGLASAVLLDRPDIRAAEHRLQAMYANIGAARANFFPRISLTGSLGFASRALGGLFTGGAGVWAFLPQASAPIFDGGRNRATLKVAEIDRDLAVAAYEQAIQVAFREVADALAVRETIDAQVAARQAVVDAAADGLRLADARFRGGVDNYLPVLDAQRAHYQAQQDLIAARLARSANAVSLYRALGGGWSPTSEETGPAPAQP